MQLSILKLLLILNHFYITLKTPKIFDQKQIAKYNAVINRGHYNSCDQLLTTNIH